MDFKFVDVDYLSEEELIQVLNYNHRVYLMKKEEISRLQSATLFDDVKNKVDKNCKIGKTKIEKNKDSFFEEEVDYYLSDFLDLSEEELDTSKLQEVLPVRKNYNYKKILLRIIAEVNREIKEIHEVILSDSSFSESELCDFKDDIRILQKRINCLKKELSMKNDITEEEEIKNKIIFVPTSSGNLRVLDEISNIPEEYYEGFLGLFKSIQDGTFKNIRRFVNNETLKGALEVKDFKIRVVFVRLARDTYAVLTAFTKKNDNDNGYRKPIEIKMGSFRKIHKKLQEQLNNPEFIKYHEDALEELFRILKKDEQKGVDSYDKK